MLPFHRKLEDDRDARGDFHGVDGPIWIQRPQPETWQPLNRAFVEAARAAGFAEVWDQNDPESTGVGPWPRNRREGVRISTAIGYLAPARHRMNLTIRGGVHAHRVIIENGRAVGVEVESAGAIQKVRGRRVTLSAGAINSPAILMRSGIGPRDELAALGITCQVNSPGVGRNLIDHPMAFVVATPVAGIPHDPQVTNPIGIRYTATGSDEFNDMQMYILELFDANLSPGLALDLPVPSVSLAAGLQRPRSRGRLRLRSANADVPPIIELNYLDHPDDMRRMVDGVRIAWRLMHEAVRADAQGVREPDAGSGELRFRARDFHPRELHDDFSSGRHRQDGPGERSDGRRRSILPRARRRRTARRRCVGDAEHRARQYQSHLHHDRRTRRRLDAQTGLGSSPSALLNPSGMADELLTIKLYYDYKSPFAYLAMHPAYALMESHRVRLHYIPHELDVRGAFGGDLDERPERDWRKVRYLYLDARRYANARGMIIRGPQKIFDSKLSLMSGLFADKHGLFRPYSDRVFERFFKRELDIENAAALAAVMKETGLDADAFNRYAAHDGPRELAEAFAAGDRDGVFGVPTFIVDGEPFWGNDRVEWVVKKLDAMGLRR